MTQSALKRAQELDAAAEKAGGYVAMPGSLKENPRGEREFSQIRQYSLQHGKPISQMTDEDYRQIGIRYPGV